VESRGRKGAGSEKSIRLWRARTPQDEALVCWGETVLCRSEEREVWDGRDQIVVFQMVVAFLYACAEEVSRICLTSGHLLRLYCVGDFPLQSVHVYGFCRKKFVLSSLIIVMRFFNEMDMSAAKYVVKQPTFTVYIRRADRVWQYGGITLEPDKSVRTIVTAADNPQQQPRQTRDTCGKCNSGQQAPRIKPLL
jgi:hypothetical protein